MKNPKKRGYAPRHVGARRGTAPKDVVFSMLLSQITVCLILLFLAYGLRLSGLPLFQAARTAAGVILEKQADFSFLEATFARIEAVLPVWLFTPTELQLPEPTQESKAAEAQQIPVEAPLAALPEKEAPPNAVPQTSLLENSRLQQNEKTPTPPKELFSGRGGPFAPVRLVGKKQRLAAPKNAVLSPFFLTDKPVLPLAWGRLTCRFGYRLHPLTGKADFHTGVDFAAPLGAPISAVLPGTVEEVAESSAYGKYLVLRHSKNLQTVYCHCSKILAPAGAVVRKGEVLAQVGSTGISTGNHLHLEFYVAGKQANPAWVYDEF